jgi:hypothetical protein
LFVVIDLFSKLVLGWSMRHRQDRQMVIRAVAQSAPTTPLHMMRHL